MIEKKTIKRMITKFDKKKPNKITRDKIKNKIQL
jgi:hypothetical protein